jgi:von Willebrand factor type D domain
MRTFWISTQHGYIVFSTPAGIKDLVVMFDGQWKALIMYPNTFTGQMYGICGNFDGVKDNDFLLSDGVTSVLSAANPGQEIGDSYLTSDADGV